MRAHCRTYLQIPDRCVVVADETHIKGPAMVRPRGWAPVGNKVAVLASDVQARPTYSHIVAIYSGRGILELAVNHVPPSQCEDYW